MSHYGEHQCDAMGSPTAIGRAGAVLWNELVLCCGEHQRHSMRSTAVMLWGAQVPCYGED